MKDLLSSIGSPEDLKKLDMSALKKVAQEIREMLIDRVSQNGGHLAPNLGVVELTIALHRVFDLPADKLVWDVGHQAYVHKLLTGRQEEFVKLRQYQGLSGFPKISESPYDAFGTGHASTSISAALGLALARDQKNGKHRVAAIIGDGSLTGGMAYEALNHAGHVKSDLMVILNDNEMSIDHNVGALSNTFSQFRLDPNYAKMKQDIETLLRRLPAIGGTMADHLENLKERIKYLLVPGAFFEELGFRYFGPLDGHDLPQLIEILKKARELPGPILVHVLTKKGLGYTPAEKSAHTFHGVGPFCIDTGEVCKNSDIPSYTSVFSETLLELAKEDPSIVAITAAMPDGTGLRKFSKTYPKRYFDVGIAEGHAITMAAGLAQGGMKPIIPIYSTFLQRAYDSIIHDVCLQNLPVIFAIDRAGLVGEDGPTHHGAFDLSYLQCIPNLTVLAPSSKIELKEMLRWATAQTMPIAIRYPRAEVASIPEELQSSPIELGKGNLLKTGKDINILAIGSMVEVALEVSRILAESEVSCGVADARFLKPLDGELLKKLTEEAPNLATIEENSLASGFGCAVLEEMNCQGLTVQSFERFGIPDEFIEQGSRKKLLEIVGLEASAIADKILSGLGKK